VQDNRRDARDELVTGLTGPEVAGVRLAADCEPADRVLEDPDHLLKVARQAIRGNLPTFGEGQHDDLSIFVQLHQIVEEFVAIGHLTVGLELFPDQPHSSPRDVQVRAPPLWFVLRQVQGVGKFEGWTGVELAWRVVLRQLHELFRDLRQSPHLVERQDQQ
jgi:hypothetical protein